MSYRARLVSRTCYQGCTGDGGGGEGDEADSDSFQGPQQLGNKNSVLIVLGKSACYHSWVIGTLCSLYWVRVHVIIDG